MREASLQDKTIKFPHLLLYIRLLRGIGSAQNFMKMENQVKEVGYETPEVKMVEVEVEQGYALSENLENPRGGRDSDW